MSFIHWKDNKDIPLQTTRAENRMVQQKMSGVISEKIRKWRHEEIK